MATCKNCGKPLILSGGKCVYCGTVLNQSSQSNAEKEVGRKSKQIVQRRTIGTQDGKSPYSQYAGQSIIPGVKTDSFGNPQGSQYDLAKDDAFKEYKIVVMVLYNGNEVPGGDIMANAAPFLQKKGFKTKTFGYNECNNVEQIQEELNDDRCQLWLISHYSCLLSSDSLNLIYDHINRGRGLYIWSDNSPFMPIQMSS